jgi:sterol desaturase/sphingolipid hydroxylase (fatty acid hydroxylase superfamily)
MLLFRVPQIIGWFYSVLTQSFDRPALNSRFALTNLEYCGDFFLVPISLLIISFWMEWSIVSLALVSAAYAAWTLAEYLLHRYLLHKGPLRRYHLLHHRHPEALIGVSALYTGIAVASSVLLSYLARPLAPFILGILAGYFWYISFHWMVHHVPFANGRLRVIARNHSEQHHRNVHRHFGVTTRIWDRVFGTD